MARTAARNFLALFSTRWEDGRAAGSKISVRKLKSACAFGGTSRSGGGAVWARRPRLLAIRQIVVVPYATRAGKSVVSSCFAGTSVSGFF
jgi:hypothetical protein